MLVAELIDVERGVWDVGKVRQFFSEDEGQCILNIPLSEQMPKDERYWWLTGNGEFTVRSCYWLGKLGRQNQQREIVDNEAWRVIWSIEGPPKLKHFLWRACKGHLAVMERFYKRHIVQSMECRVCGAEVESVIHSLFECHYAKEIWRSSMVADIITRAPTSSMGERLVWVKERVEKKELGCYYAGRLGTAGTLKFLSRSNRMRCRLLWDLLGWWGSIMLMQGKCLEEGCARRRGLLPVGNRLQRSN
ncbi:hypothetical protein RDABS01_018299 [Bienertia sinuspersici]